MKASSIVRAYSAAMPYLPRRAFALALFSLAACGRSVGGSASPPIRIAMVVDASGTTPRSWNDAAERGLAAAAARLHFETRTERVTTRSGAEAALTLLSDEGFDDVIAASPSLANAVATVADGYPRRNFAVIGAVVRLPNVTSVRFAENDRPFAAGAVAAAASANGRIAIVAAPRPAARTAFAAGAHRVAPSTVVVAASTLAGATAAGADTALAGDAIVRLPRRGPRDLLATIDERVDAATVAVALDARSRKIASGVLCVGLSSGAVAVDGLRRSAFRPDRFAQLRAFGAEVAAGSLSPPPSPGCGTEPAPANAPNGERKF